MQKRYKRRRRNSPKRILVLIAIVLGILSLAFVLVWKSNQVKDYYAKMRRLEIERGNYIAENAALHAKLLELKSIASIHKVVTRQFGLTQNVSQRIFLTDPVAGNKKRANNEMVLYDKGIPDWIDNSVFGSGRVRAEQDQEIPGQ